MKRLVCLDGVRGLLAVYVLVSHMAPFAVLPGWVQSLVSHGGAAVDLFFILSGLVIAASLERFRGQAGPFLLARVARIFPVFLPVFAASSMLQAWPCGFDHMPWIGPAGAARSICGAYWPPTWVAEIAAHLTMTHGLFPNAVLPDVWVSFLGAAWSLATEWQFYLLAVLVAAGNGRLVRVLLVLALAGVAWRLAPEAWQFSRAFLPNKAHLFALGVASGALVRRQPGALRRYGVVLAITMAICATQPPIGRVLPPLAWTLCLLVETHERIPGLRQANRLIRSRVMAYLGAISYCVYLVNEPIHKLIGLILGPLAGGNAALFTLAWIPLAILLPLGVAGWLHRHLELPALRWGHSLAYAWAAWRMAR
jgi:peptidoglycan/LPS O-acetylase OafA/YrhL